ncbi:hypothetical protein BDV23DRAFT_47709 [Aspergillus alliaceus]|uniref:Uncharacterized protein n=1 Tax=Petromyces alliaceus TaxID=209559 RepID=A0A5N7CQ43_PETAA|nr:uncharacterized protein BDW43DRAFT_16536 [Aspergillus alliaceus]KAB8235970.1 hypothetical protein BDW43DRAFT_16536 [Aspergillus alliaceus]KAE8396321.1 hypothetical protein BDV23DRAFT_47709 [Aspergillus alliaceus]
MYVLSIFSVPLNLMTLALDLFLSCVLFVLLSWNSGWTRCTASVCASTYMVRPVYSISIQLEYPSSTRDKTDVEKGEVGHLSVIKNQVRIYVCTSYCSPDLLNNGNEQ